jgi:hypothetical protein
MPNGGFITGFLFADFSFANDNGLITPGQNGPFMLPANAQATLATGATTIDIIVQDDDEEFDDGFQDDPNGTPLNQFLQDDINATDAGGNAVTVASGSVLEVEWTLTATPVGSGEPIDLLFVAAGPGENQGDLTFVVSTAPLVPGTTYDITFKNDSGGTPYGELVCFVRGTLIRTPDGDVPVESLKLGDRVMTYDDGAQLITWTSNRMVLFPQGDERPIWVEPNSFGPDQPYQKTGFSPRHCLLQQDPQNQVIFGSDAMLTATRDCVDHSDITQQDNAAPVEYFHFMFDKHALVWANGLLSESFFPGPIARRSLDPISRARLVSIYPSLSDPEAPAPFQSVRPRMRGYESRVYQNDMIDAKSPLDKTA